MFLKGKNRFVTVLFYLSDVAAGGETSFPFAGALLLRRSRTAQRTYALRHATYVPARSLPPAVAQLRRQTTNERQRSAVSTHRTVDWRATPGGPPRVGILLGSLAGDDAPFTDGRDCKRGRQVTSVRPQCATV